MAVRMDLISLQFLLFLVVLLCVYYAVGARAGERQWLVILVANVAFYSLVGGLPLFSLVVLMAAVSWGASQRFGKLTADAKAARKATRDRVERKAIKQRLVQRKRVVLWGSIAAMLVVLGYFKYWNTILFNLGLAPSTNSLGIVLPLGISFYTFISLGYLIDTYNDKFAPEASFLRYLAFVSYFPQLLQGPINHYDTMAGQLAKVHRADWHGMRKGVLRIELGLIKKVVIANMLASKAGAILEKVNPQMSGAVVLWSMVFYSLQMYGDFSGGIDMVEGVSELMGIEMDPNFRQPYLATSLSDFWRRWHMSLGAFMRDYCFYPLAVTKPMQNFGKWAKGKLGTHAGRTLPACVANIVVFLLVGLWHGAEYHYVAWGLANGFIIAGSDLLAPAFKRLGELLHVRIESAGYHVFAIIRTFFVVCLCRYFDAIASVRIGVTALWCTFFNFLPKVAFTQALADAGIRYAGTLGFQPTVIAACLVVFAIDLFEERGTDVRDAILSWGHVRRLALQLGCALLIFSALPQTLTGGVSFMYAGL